MINTLLVYGYHRSGHYSAALAVKEEFEFRGYKADIQNIWINTSEVIDRLFTIFRTFANNRNKNVPDFLGSQELLTHLANELPVNLDLGSYDAIISIHPYSSYVLAEEKKKRELNNVLIDVHTDYTPFPIIRHESIDYHVGFVPIGNAPNDLKKKMVTSGIPISSAFYSGGVTKNNSILILGGADGCVPIKNVLSFIRKISTNHEILVFCGYNQDLFCQLSKERRPNENIFSYVEDMTKYFKSANFVITKGSGLTVTESIATNCIPIFTPPVLFWEDESAMFLSSRGVGLYLPDYGRDSLKSLELLLASPDQQNLMKTRLENMKRPNSAKDIVNLVKDKPKISANQDDIRLVNDMIDYLQFFQYDRLSFNGTAHYLTEEIKRWLERNQE